MKKRLLGIILAGAMLCSLTACSLPVVGEVYTSDEYEAKVKELTDENTALQTENDSLKAQLAELQTQSVLDSAVPADGTTADGTVTDETASDAAVDTSGAYSETDFESALNGSNDCTGLLVTFTVQELHPNSTYGYNLWAGEHLNFCSSSDPGVAVGDTLTVKVTGVEKVNSSWIVYYEIV